MAAGRRKTHVEYEEELLSKEIDALPLEEYAGSDTPILHECLFGHTWHVRPQTILRGGGCPICHGNSKKTATAYEEELFIKNILDLPLESYLGADTPILHECVNGHKLKRAPSNVLRRGSCPKCVNNIKINTNEEYIEKLILKGIEHRPIDNYINTDTPITHKCINNHEWKIAPVHVLQDRTCPKCSQKNGFYCSSFFNNNPESAQQPGLLYCVVLIDKRSDEKVCLKIGITKGKSNKDVLSRISHFKGYEARILKVVKGTLEEVYYLEQTLHDQWANEKYVSPWSFGGHSELFNLKSEIIRSVPATV